MLPPTAPHRSNAEEVISGSREMRAEKNVGLQERMKSTENSDKYLDFVLYPKYITKRFFKKFSGCNLENRLWGKQGVGKNGSGKSI